MEILVFTADKKTAARFSGLEKGGKHTVRLLSPERFSSTLKAGRGDAFIYLDAAAFGEAKITGLLKKSSAGGRHLIGVCDGKGVIRDPALLLLSGLADYIGPQTAKMPLTVARFDLVTGLVLKARRKTPNSKPEADEDRSGAQAPATPDWETVEPGREYLFTMMYVELDGSKDFGQRLDRAAVDGLLDYFQKAVAAVAARESGRIWIWKDFGGIVLFPGGKKIDGIVAACLRLMLSRRLLSVDLKLCKVLLSYRIVLIPGATVYRERGKTGRIISDAVNSLSHIGARFAAPGNFYIANGFHKKLPAELADCFRDAGKFEGTSLCRMALPHKY